MDLDDPHAPFLDDDRERQLLAETLWETLVLSLLTPAERCIWRLEQDPNRDQPKKITWKGSSELGSVGTNDYCLAPGSYPLHHIKKRRIFKRLCWNFYHSGVWRISCCYHSYPSRCSCIILPGVVCTWLLPCSHCMFIVIRSHNPICIASVSVCWMWVVFFVFLSP